LRHFVKYDSYKNRIVFSERIASGILPEFAGAVRQWSQRNPGGQLKLDFSQVVKAFANGMLGIIAIVSELRRQGTDIDIIFPSLGSSIDFFAATNWAHLLDPGRPEDGTVYKKHFVRQFTRFEELPALIDRFMDIVMRHIEMPADILAALEWSVNEICDNVINHSDSKTGGFLQVIAYPKDHLIAFTVADAGIGILTSLREGFPALENEVEAIDEAIKAGITRNKEYGQGNGLAGTQRITALTGGSLDILSGAGRVVITPTKEMRSLSEQSKHFPGTCISGQIRINKEFSVSKALTFGAVPYDSYTIVDAKYELQQEDALEIKMRDQQSGTGTRAAGMEMRNKVINLLTAKPDYPLYIDWQEVSIISSSFADEFIAKLFLRLGKEKFEQLISHTHIDPLISQLIAKAIAERVAST
jgi:anti-sigma regulatory factor (Ser/Thr protein kinase)